MQLRNAFLLPEGAGGARPRRRRGPRVRLGRGADDRGFARRHDAAERGRDDPCENPGQRRARRNPGRPRGSDAPAALHPQRHRTAGSDAADRRTTSRRRPPTRRRRRRRRDADAGVHDRTTPRPDGRKPAELRAVSIETGVARHAEGSALDLARRTRRSSARPPSRSASRRFSRAPAAAGSRPSTGCSRAPRTRARRARRRRASRAAARSRSSA